MSIAPVRPSFRLKPIAFCVAIATVAPLAVQAEILELVAKGGYSLGGSGTTNLIDGPRTTGSVDVLRFVNDVNGNNVGLHSYGSDPGGFGSGNFGTRSSGNGVYDVTGSFLLRERISNNTGVARRVSFNFNITPGTLSNDLANAFGVGEFVQSSVDFNLNVLRTSGTTNRFSSHASLRSDSTSTGQFTKSGETSFYTPVSSLYYSIDSFSKTLDLGVLADGESLEIDYEIKSAASGNAANSAGGLIIPEETVTIPGHWVWRNVSFDNNVEGANPNEANNGECYGGEIGAAALIGDLAVVVDPGPPPTDSPCWSFVGAQTVVIPEHTINNTEPNGSQGSSGDPFTLSLGPNPGDPGYYNGLLPVLGGATLGDPAIGVPEPGVLALFGLGLTGLVLRRRQR